MTAHFAARFITAAGMRLVFLGAICALGACQSPVVKSYDENHVPCRTVAVSPTGDSSFDGPVPNFASADTDPLRALAISDSFIVTAHDIHGAVERFDRANGVRKWIWYAPNFVHNAPAIARGRVFPTWGDSHVRYQGTTSIVLGRGAGGVAALDAASGRSLWRFAVHGSVMTSVVVFDDTVYALSGERRLYGLAASTGRMLFNVPLPGVPAMANPRVLGDRLILGLSVPGTLMAMNLHTRVVEWKTHISGLDAGINDVNPLFARGLIVTTGTQLLKNWSLLRADGLWLLWRKVVLKLKRDGLPPASRQYVIALDACDGSLVWQSQAGIGIHVEANRSGAPVSDGKLIYVASPALQGVVAFDFEGHQRWTTPVTSIAKGAVIVGERGILVLRTDGSILELDPMTGTVLAHTEKTLDAVDIVVPYRFRDTVVVLTRRGTTRAIARRPL